MGVFAVAAILVLLTIHLRDEDQAGAAPGPAQPAARAAVSASA